MKRWLLLVGILVLVFGGVAYAYNYKSTDTAIKSQDVTVTPTSVHAYVAPYRYYFRPWVWVPPRSAYGFYDYPVPRQPYGFYEYPVPRQPHVFWHHCPQDFHLHVDVK